MNACNRSRRSSATAGIPAIQSPLLERELECEKKALRRGERFPVFGVVAFQALGGFAAGAHYASARCRPPISTLRGHGAKVAPSAGWAGFLPCTRDLDRRASSASRDRCRPVARRSSRVPGASRSGPAPARRALRAALPALRSEVDPGVPGPGGAAEVPDDG